MRTHLNSPSEFRAGQCGLKLPVYLFEHVTQRDQLACHRGAERGMILPQFSVAIEVSLTAVTYVKLSSTAVL